MKLEQQELDALKEVSASTTRLKVQLGELELAKHETIKQIEIVKAKAIEIEKKLADKYGQNSVINMQTGEVKEQKNEST